MTLPNQMTSPDQKIPYLLSFKNGDFNEQNYERAESNLIGIGVQRSRRRFN